MTIYSMSRMKTLQPGIEALYEYQAVRYHHFNVDPGATLALVADPWSFLHGHLLDAARGRRGDNRITSDSAQHYCRLAEGFYRAAESAAVPAKYLLTYYGMLNLVKTLLSARGHRLGDRIEHHGLSLTPDSEQDLTIRGGMDSCHDIYAYFCTELDTPVKKQRVSISDVCSGIPEIHEVASAANLATKRKYLPVEIAFKVNDTKKKVFTEISYDKKHEARIDTSKFMVGQRAEYFEKMPDGLTKATVVAFRSRSRRNVSKQSWPRVYRNICESYGSFNLCSLITRAGYKYYCDLFPGPLHHLASSYALMFYLGSVARYRPQETAKVLEGRLRTVVGEAIAVIPSQFLYQMAGHITDRVCVVPLAKIA